MNRYDPLYDFLEDIKDKNEIILTLKEIEEILGKKCRKKHILKYKGGRIQIVI